MRTGSRTAPILAVAVCCAAAAGLTGCGGPARDGYAAVGAAAPGPSGARGQRGAPGRRGVPAPAGRLRDLGLGLLRRLYVARRAGVPVPGLRRGGATATAPVGSVAPPGTPPDPAGPPPQPGAGARVARGPVHPVGRHEAARNEAARNGAAGNEAAGHHHARAARDARRPARLTVGAPVRAAASERRCELVTVSFANTGGAAVRSGTVSFATHIIGALGIDWATITTTQPLPTPIAGGTSKTQTYTVCVEAWRVPLGMRVETRNVTATWS
ncbi:hypothetical protein [Streptomyces sp. RerS4]|uniref:hypothetical protein n=1 Tax=Streptomyces sp. RerS4 TaxID=2942449 RepID=UPI00201C879D|nr:hypothetical protein [Streptomyces sp. RerS4]UQX02106.1 hypothetical protein M4D82_17580 [Streptomyces sp. RerS4]